MSAQAGYVDNTYLQVSYEYDRGLFAGRRFSKLRNAEADPTNNVCAGQIRVKIATWDNIEESWQALSFHAPSICQVQATLSDNSLRYGSVTGYVESRTQAFFSVTIEHWDIEGRELVRWNNSDELELSLYFDGNDIPILQHSMSSEVC